MIVLADAVRQRPVGWFPLRLEVTDRVMACYAEGQHLASLRLPSSSLELGLRAEASRPDSDVRFRNVRLGVPGS